MVRRLQLLEPEHRPSGRRLVALGNRIRDGLLRDNKVIPAVLGVLALLIFVWVIAGALTGGSNDQGGQQASNQGSVSQTPEEGSDSGSSGTPAPEAENRDADSYSAFKAKDPFREIVPPARETTTKESTRESTAGGSGSSGGSNSRSGGSRGSDSRSGGGTGGSSENNDEDFIDQTSPENSSRGGGGSRGAEGDSSGGGADQDGGAGQGGNDNLFNSGGDLAP